MKSSPHPHQTMQRVKVGMIGLAAIVLLIGLASAIFSAANRDRGADARRADTVANLTLGNGAAASDPANEPLAELGVAPTATDANTAQATPR